MKSFHYSLRQLGGVRARCNALNLPHITSMLSNN